ncbi:MAG TPA: malto-oligosyltrehalose synthase, partial [Cryptosporangiaceae bacterium]|nr:malto-oligosyltrehalose synthase [Cryptosporangiaceae bacterium]
RALGEAGAALEREAAPHQAQLRREQALFEAESADLDPVANLQMRWGLSAAGGNATAAGRLRLGTLDATQVDRINQSLDQLSDVARTVHEQIARRNVAARPDTRLAQPSEARPATGPTADGTASRELPPRSVDPEQPPAPLDESVTEASRDLGDAVVRSTYRVQVQPGFDFAATAAITAYLADLGVTHLYTSPLQMAAPGSTHGYDVVEHSWVNPELGGEDGRQNLVAALRENGLGMIVDIVPNHAGVAVPAANQAWWSLLRDGPDSPYNRWFDVDWDAHRGQLMVPILGDDADLADPTKFTLVETEDGHELHYYEHRLPVAPGSVGPGDRAIDVHRKQHYRLVSWLRADSEVNYRRFFMVNDLAGLRVEDRAVFDAVHELMLGWYDAGEVDGFRVDHVDGLRDPSGYLRQLREAAPGAYLVVEKILATGEQTPSSWPVQGTTGYDALRDVTGLLVDPAGKEAFRAIDAALTGVPTDWNELAYRSKLEVTTGMLLAELNRLAALAPEIPNAKFGLAALMAAFPVYRTYGKGDRGALTAAAREARARKPELRETIDALVKRLRRSGDELAIRFEQTTGPVMAKGVEDTAGMRHTNSLLANIEVGGEPGEYGIDLGDFHALTAGRQASYPHAMTTLSTHDTKRSEDVRARLAVLSERGPEWSAAVQRWVPQLTEQVPGLDPSVAHLILQTAVGAGPVGADGLTQERLTAAMIKSAREARNDSREDGVGTSWENPNAEFEAAVEAAVAALYGDSEVARSVRAFTQGITAQGWFNSLTQKIVQLTMPGVPDTYQGQELWDYSLVDPDNRREVDYDERRRLLAALDNGWQPPVDASGAVKLLVTSRALRLQNAAPELFTGYTPLHATGPAADHAVAFDRGGAITVATRLPVGLARRGGWSATTLTLPPGQWVDALTGRLFNGGEVPVSQLLQHADDTGQIVGYPVALLVRPDAPLDAIGVTPDAIPTNAVPPTRPSVLRSRQAERVDGSGEPAAGRPARRRQLVSHADGAERPQRVSDAAVDAAVSDKAGRNTRALVRLLADAARLERANPGVKGFHVWRHRLQVVRENPLRLDEEVLGQRIAGLQGEIDVAFAVHRLAEVEPTLTAQVPSSHTTVGAELDLTEITPDGDLVYHEVKRWRPHLLSDPGADGLNERSRKLVAQALRQLTVLAHNPDYHGAPGQPHALHWTFPLGIDADVAHHLESISVPVPDPANPRRVIGHARLTVVGERVAALPSVDAGSGGGPVRAKKVPRSQFHGLGRPRPAPDLVLAQARRVVADSLAAFGQVRLVEGYADRIAIIGDDGQTWIEVPLRSGPLEDGAVAESTVDDDGVPTTITLSHRAADEVIERGLAHEIRELLALRAGHTNDVDLLVAGPASGPLRVEDLSAHDMGRIAELEVVARQGDADEMLALARHLGIVEGTEGADVRRGVIDPGLLAQVDALVAAAQAAGGDQASAADGPTASGTHSHQLEPRPAPEGAVPVGPAPAPDEPHGSSFVLVFNRLPVKQETDADGRTRWVRSPGGVVTAMAPVMQAESGVWVGWSGVPGDAPAAFDSDGIQMSPVPLSDEDISVYYDLAANSMLWPLYHGHGQPTYIQESWDRMVEVNQRFADEAVAKAAQGATVWVHDYQLQLVPEMVRRQRPDLRIGFFLHIPFPGSGQFANLPREWGDRILRGLLGADLVG